MGEIAWRVGTLPVYWLSVFVVISFLWFAFVVYKKGQEYHFHEESLMDLAVLSGVLAWLLARFTFVLFHWSVFSANWVRVILLSNYPGYHLGGVVLGLILANFILVKRGEVKTYEGLDLLALGLMGALPFERLGRVVIGAPPSGVGPLPLELIQALLFLSAFVWLWRLEREYRTIKWYRFHQTAAKPGFIVGMAGVMLGTILASTGIWPKFTLEQLIMGAIFILLGGAVIYFRSGRRLGRPFLLKK